MNLRSLIFRNLAYFRGVNLAVITGVAVATAVLTGALMVGDSVRRSLADLAVARLGPVDYALFSTRFFDQSLAGRVGQGVTGAIILRGGAVNDSSNDSPRPRTADVQIAALAGPAPQFPDISGLPLPPGESTLNVELAAGLGISSPGATAILTVPAQSDLPRESALARRGRNDLLNEIRTTVRAVDAGVGFVAAFSPTASQRASRNAWVNLKDLQEAIDQPGRVNALLAHAEGSGAESAIQSLNDRIRQVVTLQDYGLEISPAGNDEAGVFSRQTYLSPPEVDAAAQAADALRLHLRKVSVNLLNVVTNVAPGGPQGGPKTIHYAVAAGISDVDAGPLAADEVAINQWTADQLGARPGDTLRIDFPLRLPGGDLTTASERLAPGALLFKVKFILPMSGLGADPRLPPNYKGLTDAQSVADWDPPEGLVIDKSLVTRADEDYWHRYRAAPKVFLNFETAGKLWGGVYGNVTGLRVPAASKGAFAAAFLARLDPAAVGLVFRPIKAEQLAAANGGTDFSMFFLMFSFFLIVAAALLVAILFRLNVEQRARQLGLMGAVGFTRGALRKMALAEGMILAAVGSAVGLAGAIAYTWLILLGLRTWWVGAVGTTALSLHISPLTLLYGFVASALVAACTIAWAVWRVGGEAPARLLAGGWSARFRRPGAFAWLRWCAAVVALGGAAVVVVALRGGVSVEAGFGGGALLLVALLAWTAAVLRPRRSRQPAPLRSLVALGMRNASRHTARSALAVGLVAFAAFTLITVAAMKQDGSANPDRRDSETGGYRLILDAAIGLGGDLNTVQGRKLMGITDPENPLYAAAHFTSLRRWAGQDISCLNLTRPTAPTILGLPREMIDRGGFIPGDALNPGANIWKSLEQTDPDGATPVIADSDTQEYVLQIPLGGTIDITDQLGVRRKLKLVATVAHSIFQGQLLMSDGNFRRLFPAQSGFGTVLIETDAAHQEPLARKLSAELEDFSVSVESTSARLRMYQNVQNTYLATFQTLGALGLMLGTIGLAVVLVRTILERRSELALLAALGFSSAARQQLVLSENGLLLLAGLGVGAVSALAGILPAVVRDGRPINLLELSLTLLAVLVIGLAAGVSAVALSGVRIAPRDLRRE